ncbi:MAG TPA: tagaturonate reductase [Patescibacteria group bacterium]|nr:tagaturonate reductase [Patescibacteria group bacterium]
MRKLNKNLLKQRDDFPVGLEVSSYPENLPEKVIQFGEGNFLRAFVDWMFHRLNRQGMFNGRVILVQPIADGLAKQINDQDGLYTLLLRGLKEGKPMEVREIITSVSRCINPYTDWEEYLRCAENPEIEYVVSNTTEAGIVFDGHDRCDVKPPVSFPGKLTVYLYHRFCHFQGDAGKGMVIIPCELIDRNGDNLKKVIVQLADIWKLPAAFKIWLDTANVFLNTLVDRVVTGYPRDEEEKLSQEWGYTDELIDTGELFHLWVIEGPKELEQRLPFTQVGLDVIWTEDMTPYRTRKVRILNGAHTSSVPAAFLYGLDTVGEMMDHEVLGKYVRQIVAEEIIPSIPLQKEMLTRFADDVVERFCNPYIKHYLLSILLNSSSKFKTRVLPSLLEYFEEHQVLPEKLTFSLAALIAVYKHGRVDGAIMQAQRDQGEFVMKDDLTVLEFMADVWGEYDKTAAGARRVASRILANQEIWGQDLNIVPGLTDKVGSYLESMEREGIRKVIAGLVK